MTRSAPSATPDLTSASTCDLPAGDERAELRPRVVAGSDPQLARRGGRLGGELVDPGGGHEQPGIRGADLPGVEQAAHHVARDRRVDVGVRQHDARRLAAQLKREPLEVARGRHHDLLAHRGGTGERDLVHPPMGKEIVVASAGNLKRLSLELGGKAPSIVLPDADIDAAVAGNVMGGLFNTGQVCAAYTPAVGAPPGSTSSPRAAAASELRIRIRDDPRRGSARWSPRAGSCEQQVTVQASPTEPGHRQQPGRRTARLLYQPTGLRRGAGARMSITKGSLAARAVVLSYTDHPTRWWRRANATQLQGSPPRSGPGTWPHHKLHGGKGQQGVDREELGRPSSSSSWSTAGAARWQAAAINKYTDQERVDSYNYYIHGLKDVVLGASVGLRQRGRDLALNEDAHPFTG